MRLASGARRRVGVGVGVGVGTAAAMAAVAVVVCALAGCSASAAPAPSPTVPAGFPTSVPVIPGRVVASDVTTGEWKVWVRAAHPAAGYTAAMALLTKAAMHTTSSQTFADSGEGQACDARYCATVSADDDPEHGPSVEYEVFSSKGY